MEQVRLGTIGSGVIVHSVLDNVVKTEGIALEAVYSRSSEKAKRVDLIAHIQAAIHEIISHIRY